MRVERNADQTWKFIDERSYFLFFFFFFFREIQPVCRLLMYMCEIYVIYALNYHILRCLRKFAKYQH